MPSNQAPAILGLLGWPVGHSVSPPMHNAGFQAEGLNGTYTTFGVPPDQLAAAVAGLRVLGIVGCNVTVPHKQAIMPLLDEIGPSAVLAGAVNTVVNRGGRLSGHNTDGEGFIASLHESGIDPSGRPAVILGAGGSARAVAAHLAEAGATALGIINRTVARAAELAQFLRPGATARRAGVRVAAANSAEATDLLAAAGLVVNCTTLGMAPQVDGTPLSDLSPLAADAVVVDIVFNPAETRLLREARARGLKTLGGLGMLVHQGACSWRYWFDRAQPGPVPVMAAAARAALDARRG